jgi:hypothetical protein
LPAEKLFPLNRFNGCTPKRPKVLKLNLVFPNDSANERLPLRFVLFNTSACPLIGKNIQLKTNPSQITHTLHVMGLRLFAPVLTREEVVSLSLSETP